MIIENFDAWLLLAKKVETHFKTTGVYITYVEREVVEELVLYHPNSPIRALEHLSSMTLKNNIVIVSFDSPEFDFPINP